MRNQSIGSRRSFLAGFGTTAVAAVAGCQGDSNHPDGENSTEGNDGAATDELQPRGELVASHTITEEGEWEFDLTEGETISVVARASDGVGASGEIRPSVSTSPLVNLDAVHSEPDMMQYTADEEATYIVEMLVRDAGTEGTVSMEIHIDR